MLRIDQCVPGALVECYRKKSPQNPAILGALYTISHALEGITKEGEPDIGVCFVDLPNIPRSPGYDRRGFRVPPDSRLAVFRAMLAPSPVLEPTP